MFDKLRRFYDSRLTLEIEYVNMWIGCDLWGFWVGPFPIKVRFYLKGKDDNAETPN